MCDPYNDTIAENEGIYKSILQSRGELKPLKIIKVVALCKLFKEKYFSLKIKLFGVGKEVDVANAVREVNYIETCLLERLKEEADIGELVDMLVKVELEKLKAKI